MNTLTPIQRFRSHPAYVELLARYKAARQAWFYIFPNLTIPMEQRAYCDAYVNQAGLIVWTGNGTNHGTEYEFTVEQAWLDSMEQ